MKVRDSFRRLSQFLDIFNRTEPAATFFVLTHIWGEVFHWRSVYTSPLLRLTPLHGVEVRQPLRGFWSFLNDWTNIVINLFCERVLLLVSEWNLDNRSFWVCYALRSRGWGCLYGDFYFNNRFLSNSYNFVRLWLKLYFFTDTDNFKGHVSFIWVDRFFGDVRFLVIFLTRR